MHLKEELERRRSDAELLIPVEIFGSSLSPAESLVKYLKEEHSLRFRDIAACLNRDERGVWGTYRRATVKAPSPFILSPQSSCLIPVSEFANRQYSILEAALLYLVEHHQLRISALTSMFNKAYSTLYTTYRRALTKRGDSS